MSDKENVKSAKQWLTPVFRVSHPHLFKPSKMKEGAPEYYGVEMLFDKTKVKKSDIEKPLLSAIKEKWGDSQSEWPQPLKLPFRDGDKPHGKKREVKPEHKGMWVVKTATKAEFGKPAVVDQNRNPIENAADLYPGCFARAFVMAQAYVNPEKDGVSFILDGVQKFGEGTALGGKKPVDQMFCIIEDEGGVSAPTEDAGLSGFGDIEDEAPADGESFF